MRLVSIRPVIEFGTSKIKEFESWTKNWRNKMNLVSQEGFNVFVNDQLVGFIQGRNLRSCQDYIKQNLKSTHMGEWRKELGPGFPGLRKPFHYYYSTTIGKYYHFQPTQLTKEGNPFRY